MFTAINEWMDDFISHHTLTLNVQHRRGNPSSISSFSVCVLPLIEIPLDQIMKIGDGMTFGCFLPSMQHCGRFERKTEERRLSERSFLKSGLTFGIWG